MESSVLENNSDVNNDLIEKPINFKIIRIEFKKSKSKRFQDAVYLISNLPNYEHSKLYKIYSFEINEIKDYAKYYLMIEELISIISNWKSAVITLYGKEYSNNWDYYEFKEKITSQAGPYDVVLKSYTECAINSVTFEDLPLPLVYYPSHYGAFFAFSNDVEEEIFFCECERKAIENYIRINEISHFNSGNEHIKAPLGNDCFPKYISIRSLESKSNPLSLFGFKENLCFRCNNIIPKLKYCHPMYGTAFKQKYGWYINQKYFELGIDKYQISNNSLINEDCPPQIYDEIVHYNKLCSQRIDEKYNEEIEKEITLYMKGIEDTVENITRVELGFPKIGELWTSEVVMFNIVEGMYPEYKTKRHHRPKWLEGLEIDIFIPELNLAFEYQGIQHYEPVSHWGGLKQLEKQQKNDKRKKELCEKHGVDLIIVNYNEELSTDHLKRKISNIVDK